MEEQESRSHEQEGSRAGSSEPDSIRINAKRNKNHASYASKDEAYYRDAQIDHLTDEFFGWLRSQKTRPHEAIMAFSSIAMLIVVGWQIYSSPTSGQTSQLIQQATIQAEAAEKFRVAADGINAQVGNAVGKLGDQVGRLGANVTQTGRLADETGKANQNASDADRPWLGAQIIVSDFDPDHSPTGTCIFANSGRRPARVEQARCATEIFETMPSEFTYGDVPISSRVFVVPGANVSSKINLVNERMYFRVAKNGKYTKELFDLLDSKKAIFVVYGKIEYIDVRDGTNHFTHSCVQYTPATQFTTAGFSACDTYNDAN